MGMSSPKVPDTPPPPNMPIAANFSQGAMAGTNWIKNAGAGYAGTLLAGKEGNNVTGATSTTKNTLLGQG